MLSAAVWQVCVIRLEQVKPQDGPKRSGETKMITAIAGAMIVGIKLVVIAQLRRA
jgi:hypothetical protein